MNNSSMSYSFFQNILYDNIKCEIKCTTKCVTAFFVLILANNINFKYNMCQITIVSLLEDNN